jgi:hypothetical protein
MDVNSQSPALSAIQTCINTEQRENKEVSRWMSHSKHKITYRSILKWQVGKMSRRPNGVRPNDAHLKKNGQKAKKRKELIVFLSKCFKRGK